MSQGPSLQGQIVINTKSVDQAITSIKKLEVNVAKAFGDGTRSASRFASSLNKQTKAYGKVSQANSQYQNIVAKAANSVANYESAVRKSNVTDAKKAQLVKQASASLKGFEQAVKAGATSGQSLTNVTTQLNVSLGQMKRQLSSASAAEQSKIKSAKALEASQVRNSKAISQGNQAYARAKAAIASAGMSMRDEQQVVYQLTSAHNNLNSVLNKTGSTVRQTTAAQNRYKEALNQVNIQTKRSSTAGSGQANNRYADSMRNLSTSVIMALGPLSGVASRLTALTALFNRNAISMAAVLAGLTSLSVLFAKSAQVGAEAEKQMFRINAQLDIMGGNAQVTGDEINAMAHKIAAGTLLSAKEVRDASGALIEFGGVGRSQFEDVIKTAQGMSVVFGGNLRSNIRKLGRAIEEPVDGIQRLETAGVIFTESTKEQIKTLSEQGLKMEATNILLKETASLSAAAGAEAKGLTGSYDTLSGNLDHLYETLFNASGASKALSGSVNDVSAAVSDFAASEDARILGETFRSMATMAGTSFKFLIDNLRLIGLGITFIAASALPKLLVVLTAMVGRMYASSVASMKAALSMGAFVSATGSATISTRAFTAALLTNPFVAVAVGLATLTAAMWSYNSARDALAAENAGISKAVLTQINQQIALQDKLTKSEIDGFRSKRDNIEKTLRDNREMYQESLDLEERLTSEIRKRARAESAGGRQGTLQAMALEKQIGTMQGLEALAEGLTGEQRKSVIELLESKRASEAYKTALEGVVSEAEKLRDTIKEYQSAGESTDPNRALEGQIQNMERLNKTYVKQTDALKTMRSDLEATTKSAKGIQEALDNGSYDDENIKSATEALRAFQKLSVQIRKDIEDNQYGSAYQGLIDKIGEVNSEAAKAQRALNLTPSETAYQDTQAQMEKLREETTKVIAELNEKEKAELRNTLSVVGLGTGVDELAESYAAYITMQDQATQRTQSLTGFYSEQASEMTLLTQKYDELAIAANAQMDGGKASGDVDKARKLGEEKITKKAGDLSTTPFTGSAEKMQEEFEIRKEQLKGLYEEEDADYDKHLSDMKALSDKNQAFASFGAGAQDAADIVGGAMKVMQTAGKENSKVYQAMAVAQATISGAMGIAAIWGADAVNPAIAIAKTALIAASVGAQIATIKGASYATGGQVTGPGTATSDSIPANLSNGEYVMKAEAVRKIGLNQLNKMNSGQMAQFSGGGAVGIPFVGPAGNSQGSVSITVVDNSSGEKEYKTEETTDEFGEKKIRLMINSVVKEGVMRGNYDSEFGASYGLRRGGRTV